MSYQDEPRTMFDDNIRKNDKLKQVRKAKKAFGGKSYTLDDTGNANAFVDMYGEDIRYDCKNKVWMIYDGATWRVDSKQDIKKLTDDFIEAYRGRIKELVGASDDEDTLGFISALKKNISRISNTSGKEALLKEAQHIGITPCDPTDFDNIPHILNCKNGVVDLTCGRLVEHDRRYMSAKNTNVDIDLEHEPTRFLQFMNEIFCGKKDMVDYMQTAIGYTLTGENREQCMFQCCGIGGNGKSVLMDLMSEIMGDYAINVKIESILTKSMTSGGGASPDIARMNGARLIRTNEPDEGAKLNEGFVKQLVGGDIITARNLFGLDFEFKPVGKLWVATNHKLVIRGTDRGIWRRQQLIKFDRIFDEKQADKTLPDKLRQEYPEILGWMVRGAEKWYKQGLKTPAYVEDANQEYRLEMDVVANFLTECVTIKPYGKERSADVYKAYSDWCKIGNEYKMSQTKFGLEMNKHFKKVMISGYGYYQGFVLKSKDTSYTYTEEDY